MFLPLYTYIHTSVPPILSCKLHLLHQPCATYHSLSINPQRSRTRTWLAVVGHRAGEENLFNSYHCCCFCNCCCRFFSSFIIYFCPIFHCKNIVASPFVHACVCAYIGIVVFENLFRQRTERDKDCSVVNLAFSFKSENLKLVLHT